MFFFMNQRRLLLAGGAAGAVFKSFADTCNWSPSPASCMKITEVAGFIPREFGAAVCNPHLWYTWSIQKGSSKLQRFEGTRIITNWETKSKKPEISSFSEAHHEIQKIWIDWFWSNCDCIQLKSKHIPSTCPEIHVELFACQKIQFPGKISHLFALGVMTLEDSKLWEAPMKMEDSLVLWTKWRNGQMNPLLKPFFLVKGWWFMMIFKKFSS